jgi:GTP cyclohydrolase I
MKSSAKKAREKERPLHDIQSSRDHRKLDIDQVGVCDLRYPITVLDRKNDRQHTMANISMSVSLPHHFKGTHMSRFLTVLNRHRGEITMRTLPTVLAELKLDLEAASAQVEVSFPYVVEKSAPVSGQKGLMDYDCTFAAVSNGSADDFVLGVAVPVTSLCPCSKAISDYGAHNQRGIVRIEIRTGKKRNGEQELVWIEELIEMAEKSASCPVYPLLKREDEKYVTEHAFDNPVFVEDIVRNVAQKLQRDKRVAWYSVRVVNQESIHNHSAFARIERSIGRESLA